MTLTTASRTALVVALLAAALTAVTSTAHAAEPEPATVTVDFAKNNGPGHPDVFGSGRNSCNPDFGASAPCRDTAARMETLRQSGVRFMRRDAYLSEIVPDSTIDDYLKNVNGVADPRNWDWSKYQWVDTYHDAGFTVMLVMGYNVPWNGYGCGGTCPGFGPSVPKNFDVYADMVRKVYQHFHGKVDLVEIWNEPDSGNFFNLTGSPYPETLAGRLRAYTDVYDQASSAIRKVSTSIPIGGPVVTNPAAGPDWVNALLHDRRIPAKNVNFLSYHNYKESVTTESVTDWKNLAAAAGRGKDFPVYVTEWNRSPAYDQNPLSTDHPDTVSSTASRLTTFFRQHANGTNYFNDNDSDSWPAFFGIYANGTLPPKSRTYRLLSQDLGLGAGPSTIRDVVCNTGFSCPLTNGAAATNSAGDQVAWVVNNNTTPVEVTMNLSGLKDSGSWTANIFEASANAAVTSPRSAVRLIVARGKASFTTLAPPKSVIGVRLTRNQLDVENLAPAATVTSSSSFPGYPASNVTDGVTGLAGSGEWASAGEQRPWVRLTWPGPRTIGRVVLYARATGERVLAGRLVFGDGTSVPVPALPNDGTGRAVSFPSRSADSVRFEVTDGSGPNVGLSEFQVYEGANIAREGTVTSSSQLDRTTHAHVNVVDGIAGQQTGEWASRERNPWVQVSWVDPRTIEQVVVYDRADKTSNATSGVLTFSDGSTIPVTGIPKDGSAKAVRFPARSAAWVRFQVTGGSGSNVGLSELRIFRGADLASSATATASSAFDAPLDPSAVTDGITGQRFSGEWAAKGEPNPWIQLTWPDAQRVGQVVLHDRISLSDNANGGTLTFSDGTSVAISGIDTTGVGKVVEFPARTVTWVRFQVNSGTGQNVGLSEFEAFPPS